MLAQQTDLKPIPIGSNGIKLTQNQSNLLTFLKSRIVHNKPITRKCILNFYISYVKGSEFYASPIYDYVERNGEKIWAWTGKNKDARWRDEWNIENQAITWFSSNLGKCILKGKIIALPVIEIE